MNIDKYYMRIMLHNRLNSTLNCAIQGMQLQSKHFPTTIQGH